MFPRFNIDRTQILKTASNEVVYLQGLRLADSGKITIEERESEKNYFIIKAAAREDNKDYKLYVIFDYGGNLLEYRCNCDSSRIWRGACKHVVGALYSLTRDTGRDYKKIINSMAAEKLLASFEAASRAERGAALAMRTVSEEKAGLIPEFFFMPDDLPYLELTIGAGKKYIVKNIGALLSNISNAVYASYGKNLGFIHHISNFDGESQKLISFLQNHYSNITGAVKIMKLGYYREFGFTRRFYFTENAADDFFALYEGRPVKSCVDGVRASVLFTSERPDYKFNIENENENIILTGGDKVLFADGATFSYMLSGNSLHRVPRDYAETVRIINGRFSGVDKKIIFEGKNAEKLVNFVLPKLIKHGLTNDDSLGEKYRIYDLEKKVYLDLSDGVLTMKINFCYGETIFDSFETDVYTAIRRDFQEEDLLSHIVKQYEFAADHQKRIYNLNGDDKIYHFYKTGLEYLKAIAEVFATDDFKRKSPKPSGTASFGIKIEGRLLEIKPEGDYSMTELMEIAGSLNSKKKYHRLKNGEFIDLESDSNGLNDTVNFLNALDLSKKDLTDGGAHLPLYKAMFIDSLTEESPVEIKRDEVFKEMVDELKNYKTSDKKIPETLADVLRNYQKEGFRWLTALANRGFGGILADDMGLGKTIQVISVILSRKKDPDAKPSLVVAPTSLIYNWEKEINRFAPGLNPLVIAGTQIKRGDLRDIRADIYITTYDLLKRDFDYYAGNEYGLLIADEAQYIKNPGTQNARAIKKINAQARFALTGTPIENSFSELWSIFDFVMPGFLYNHGRFIKQFETPVIKHNDAEAAARLKKMIGPFVMRRLKKDVLQEIPDKLLTAMYAEMEPGQKKIYAAYLMKARGELNDVLDKKMMAESRIKILSYITRLRQICCHPSLFMENYGGGSGKLPMTVEIIKNSIGSGRRMLLFSQFTSMLEIVKAELDSHSIPYFYLDGATGSRKRLETADRFNSGERDIFLISLKAGGTGLNLTGADVVIHYDPWWNPAVMDQATDRAHRIGQKNVVQIYNIVAKDSIEEKIIALQEKKRDLIDLVIKDGANLINRLTEEEIADLFE